MDINMQPSCSYISEQISKPLHVRKVESATSLQCLNQGNYATLSDTSDEEEIEVEKTNVDTSDDAITDQNDCDLSDLFDFKNVDPERVWLTKILQEEDEEEHNPRKNYTLMLREFCWRKKIKVSKEKAASRMYYGSGLISKVDRYPEVKKTRKSLPKKKKEEPPKCNYKPEIHVMAVNKKLRTYAPPVFKNPVKQEKTYPATIVHPSQCTPVVRGNFNAPATVVSSTSRNKKRKFKDEEAKKKWEDVMTLKRRKVFTNIVKKEVNKQHRAKMNKHKEVLLQCKRAALQCQKFVRQKALQSARIVKEQQWRMKRLARENLAYWKRSKRVDREIRRKLEKEAEEQRKIDFEFIEAKRQQRKLNFLITQTELYAHFMSRKLGKGSPEEQLRILSQLDEEKNPRLASIDDYDAQLMKAKAMKNAEDAFQNERTRNKYFDTRSNCSIDENRSPDCEHPQPLIFRGVLKGYQLRGMNWLANLYDQGISGILADEMGLGKTVQSIAFLCHVAEKYSVWGPFLIISPASTLHNWQQELAKFVPDFKVVPYWGNPNERKILRQFWNQKDMHTKSASFHIVVTSYQIVITDIKYFNRVKWQYMILDEAQAIKSASSMRWKMLLGFSCKNRLLLSGTPIQNSMAELWALLHFIMPTLFDSHEEFNEWFSKDIESHAENKTGIDEKHLSRLHMILKPFMLRRIKRDVENELSDKIEVMVFCPLTTRQKLLYFALKKKIRIEDLLHYTVGGGDSHALDKNFTSNLMNLVMQFRKVCNHPELFERRDTKSPIYVAPHIYHIPFLVYDYNIRRKTQLLINKYFTFTPSYINNQINRNMFNFMFSLYMSPQELNLIFFGCILTRWKHFYELERRAYLKYIHKLWSNEDSKMSWWLKPYEKISPASVSASNIFKDLLFTWNCTGNNIIYTHTKHNFYFMPETLEHRNIRCKSNTEDCDRIVDVVNDDTEVRIFKYENAPPQVFECEPTILPTFLFTAIPKLETSYPILNCCSRKAAWDWKRHVDDYSWNSLNYHWTEATGSEIINRNDYFKRIPENCLDIVEPVYGWSHIIIPDKESLVSDSGKLSVLDSLLKRLKEEGHRVLIYSQMTKMIDLLEEYMWHRHHKYMRLDGSSKISDRRDMVADFQARADIFVFLLSTRAGGLGINLTAADTVIFYDSDWNPTVDQQAMDRAHRLGQTKQVTVYRLICKGSIEERILQRAREKSEIQKLVISGGNFKPDTLKPKEVVSLLLDDEEIELKYRQRTEERKQMEDIRESEKKRKTAIVKVEKKIKEEPMEEGNITVDSAQSSPHSEHSPVLTIAEDTDTGFLDDSDGSLTSKYTVYNLYGSTVKPRAIGRGSSKRGRPRGSRRVSALGRFNATPSTSTSISNSQPSTTVADTMNVQMATSGIYNLETTTTPTSSSTTLCSQIGFGSNSSRRGPGRPRLKPGGPTNTGTRGSYRPRKPAKPLPVPLPSDGGTIANINSDYTSYFYDFPENTTGDI